MNNAAMGFLLFLNQIDADLPVLLAVNRGGEPGCALSRPGLRRGEVRIISSWEKESGMSWVGISERGFLGAMVGGGQTSPVGAVDMVFRALEGRTPGEGADFCRRLGRAAGFSPFRMVVAGLTEAWLVQGGAEVQVVALESGITTLSPHHQPGEISLVEEALLLASGGSLDDRLREIQGILVDREERLPGFSICQDEGKQPTQAATIIGLQRGDSPTGVFRFCPDPRAGKKFLDYSNLIRRLHR